MPLAEFSDLKKAISEGEHHFVAIIGTGVSRAISDNPIATWPGLLEDGLGYCLSTGLISDARYTEGVERLRRASEDKHTLECFLDLADLITATLGGRQSDIFRRWLERSVGGLDRKPEPLLEVIGELHRRGVLMATTNYDGLLSEVLDLPPVTWRNYDQQLLAMHQKQNAVLHLHGYWREPDSIVFDRDSYKKVTDDDTFQKLLACLWMNFHWIYIGCGSTTSDPNLGKLIQWGAEKFPKSSPSHFRLCLARDTAALLEEHQTHHKLYVLPYGDKHERLPAFLRNTCDAFRCSPFVRVEEQAQFFRVSTQDPHRVVWPARQEYVNGAVYRPTFLRQVVTGLQDAGFVWLRGRASHGKTTAALLLATASEQREPVYYLDLKNEKETDAGSAVGILRSLCRPGILFILDNVNRDESLARRLFEVWNESRRSSRMLLLGRSGPENTRSCLADLQLNAVKAELKLDDFAGVFHTVLHRLAPGRPIPDPPESALEKWQTDFDSDLVAFCVAVTACERKLRRSDWALPLEAANHHIQEKYLNPKRMGVREKGNVLKLAAFSGEELGLPKEAFGRNPFKAAVADGLVVEFSQKDGSNCRFELYEPGLGPLLLAATKDTFNPAAEVFRVCRRAPSVAVAFAERLEVSGQFQQARKLLQRLLSDHKAADWLLTQHLPWAVDTLKRILRQEAGTFEELDVWLAKKPEYFTLAIRTQPLNAVGQLLRFANGKLPEVSAQLDRVLRDPKQQTLLSDKLQKTPLYEFIQFLDVLSAVGKKDLAQRLMSQYAARQDPEKAIAQALQGSLHNLAYSLNGVKKHGGATFSELLWVNLNLPVLMDRALHKDRTRADSLHLIAEFLRIAKECRPMLAKAIWSELTDDRKHWPELLKQALQDAPNNLVTFLKAAKEIDQNDCGKNGLLDWLWDALGQSQSEFVENGLRGSLHILGNFLNYAKDEGKTTLVEALWKKLEDEYVSRIITQALKCPLLYFGRFLQCVLGHKKDRLAFLLISGTHDAKLWPLFVEKLCGESAGQVIGYFRELDSKEMSAYPDETGAYLRGITVEQWLAMRKQEYSIPLDGVRVLLEFFRTHGRCDLAEAEALAIVRLANPDDWQKKKSRIKELRAAVLSNAQQATDDERSRFERRIL